MGSPPLNILPARLRAEGVAELDGGWTLSLPAGLAVAPGEAFDLGFRPEHAVLAGPGEPGLPFDLDLTEDLGTAHLLHGRIGHAQVVVSVPPGTAVEGSQLRVRVSPEAVHAFHAEHGQRIEPLSFAMAAE